VKVAMFVPAHTGLTTGVPAFTDLVQVVAAALVLAVYLLGSRPLRHRPDRRALPSWRAAAFGSGLLFLTAAVSTPVEHLADELFWAHMVQHLVLAFLAAPLLVLGRPLLVTGVLLGQRLHRVSRPLRRVGHRLRASAGFAAALVALHVVPWLLWHLPGAYELALRSTPVHLLEHATMLASGAALAWLVVGHRTPAPAAAAIGLGMASMSIVATMLAFAGASLYAGHEAVTRGLTALEDQQVGGALMWFPGSLAYLAAAAVVVLGRLRLGLAGSAAPSADHWSYR
jgi:putative membrane protein